MRAWVLSGWLAVGVAAQEVPAEARAFVQWEAEPDPCYVGQILSLRLRVGIDARFFADHALQLFHRRLDVPVQVEVAWPMPETATPLDEIAAAGERLTLALGDAVVAATRAPNATRDGQRFTVVTVTRRFLAARAGELTLPPPRLRYAHTTRFEDDFVQGRVGVDRHEVAVEGRSLALRIAPLPDTGRPAGFSGAVGRFTVRATTSVREVDAGASFPLGLHIEGEGNLHAFAPPPLTLDGFHVLGCIDTRTDGGRTLTYDVQAVRAEVTAVPAIAFAFFDPTPPASYQTVATAPIPLVVRGRGPEGRVLTAADMFPHLTPGVDDIFALKVVPMGASGSLRAPRLQLLLALVGPWLAALSFVAWRRARARAAKDHVGRRARAAAAAFHARAAAKGPDLGGAFTAYLAARLGCSAAAVISPDLAARLEAAGIPTELAARAATAVEALVAARYGSATTGAGASTTAALVDALERAFTEVDA